MSSGRKPGQLGAKRLSAPTKAVPLGELTQGHFYNHNVAHEIALLVLEGNSLYKIAEMPDKPCYSTLLRWKLNCPEFVAMLKAAEQVRADHFFECAIEAGSQEGLSRQEVENARLNFDTYAWAAEKCHPEKYGKQQKITGQIDNSQQIIFLGLPENPVDFIELDEQGLLKERAT